MKITSKYLNREFDVNAVQYEENKETVTIIPHAALEDIIYNDPDCIKRNVQVHYTQVVAEPGHYAFLCAISDSNGRRVESIGESLGETLTTTIAKNYPVLMAVKRSFDDAAIKFLYLPKMYSDQQIEPSTVSKNHPGDITADTAMVEPPDETASNKGVPEAAAEPETNPDDEKLPWGDSEEDASESLVRPETDSAASDSKEDSNDGLVTFDGEEASADAEVPANDSAVPDKFDTTIISCGSYKSKGWNVREYYKNASETVLWIAAKMSARNEKNVAQQAVCREFILLYGTDAEKEQVRKCQKEQAA